MKEMKHSTVQINFYMLILLYIIIRPLSVHDQLLFTGRYTQRVGTIHNGKHFCP